MNSQSREDEQWKRTVERYHRTQARKVAKEPMPSSEQEAKQWIADETHKCAWHSRGFSPARRVRLIAYAKEQGWRV